MAKYVNLWPSDKIYDFYRSIMMDFVFCTLKRVSSKDITLLSNVNKQQHRFFVDLSHICNILLMQWWTDKNWWNKLETKTSLRDCFNYKELIIISTY